MMQALLVASLLFNASLLYKVEFDEVDETNNCSTYECHAYEDFLEEWYKFDKERNENQSVDKFQYELPPDDEMIEEPPTEEI